MTKEEKQRWYTIRHMNKWDIAQHEAIFNKSFIQKYNDCIKELELKNVIR